MATSKRDAGFILPKCWGKTVSVGRYDILNAIDLAKRDAVGDLTVDDIHKSEA
jgi:hypothetical protein